MGTYIRLKQYFLLLLKYPSAIEASICIFNINEVKKNIFVLNKSSGKKYCNIWYQNITFQDPFTKSQAQIWTKILVPSQCYGINLLCLEELSTLWCTKFQGLHLHVYTCTLFIFLLIIIILSSNVGGLYIIK